MICFRSTSLLHTTSSRSASLMTIRKPHRADRRDRQRTPKPRRRMPTSYRCGRALALRGRLLIATLRRVRILPRLDRRRRERRQSAVIARMRVGAHTLCEDDLVVPGLVLLALVLCATFFAGVSFPVCIRKASRKNGWHDWCLRIFA